MGGGIRGTGRRQRSYADSKVLGLISRSILTGKYSAAAYPAADIFTGIKFSLRTDNLRQMDNQFYTKNIYLQKISFYCTGR